MDVFNLFDLVAGEGGKWRNCDKHQRFNARFVTAWSALRVNVTVLSPSITPTPKYRTLPNNPFIIDPFPQIASNPCINGAHWCQAFQQIRASPGSGSPSSPTDVNDLLPL